eukprot:m.324635 g.324635  ORF g.324635 m.324635 type:complete len:53 (+) comp34504_c0_seq1:85-243(+)
MSPPSFFLKKKNILSFFFREELFLSFLSPFLQILSSQKWGGVFETRALVLSS